MSKEHHINPTHRIWLIKQNRHILGPFSTKELIEKIKSEELRISDEANLPMKFWKPIYTWTELFSALKEVREGDKDFTKTIQIKSKIDETKITKTPKNIEGNTSSSETLVKMVSDEEILKETTQTQDILDNIKQDQTEKVRKAPPPSDQEETLEGNTFDFEGSDESVKEIKKSLTWLFSLSAVIVACTLVFVLYYQGFEKPKTKKANMKNHKQLALTYWKKGDLKNSLQHFNEAYRGTEKVDEFSLIYAGLLAYNDQTTKARTLFEKISKQQEGKKNLALNGLGLSYLYDGQKDKALPYFKEALSEKKDFSSYVNSGIIYLQNRKYNEIFGFFQKAEKINKPSRLLEFLNGMTYFLLAKEFKDLTYFNQSLIFFESLIETPGRFYQEALFFSALIYESTNQNSRLPQVILKILDTDPEITEHYRPNLNVFQKFYSWRTYFNSCKALSKKISKAFLKDTFFAFCHFKVGNFQDAKKLFENLVAEHPHNPLGKALYSYVLKKQNLNLDASVVLGGASDENRTHKSKLPHLFQGNFCYENKDYDCALKQFEKLFYDLSSLEPPVISGLAYTYWKLKNQAKAKAFLEKGLNFYPEYIPLLSLKETLK